ncbi:MAG: FMN-binding protein [Lentisphaeria bacterium]|nr:FMN-binding protein [Lentisphaeria bacterium]
MNLRDSENIWVLGGFLCAVALAAAFTLALVADWTAGPIEKAQERNRAVVLRQLRLPEFDQTGSSVRVGDWEYFAVGRSGKVVGFVGQGANRLGYAGEIAAMVGFAPDGKITGVQILRHKETPGLGANVCDRKFKRTILNLFAAAPTVPDNEYLDQFGGRPASSAGKWRVRKDGGEFFYRTGATVSSRAVTKLVNDIAAAFAGARREIAERSVL